MLAAIICPKQPGLTSRSFSPYWIVMQNNPLATLPVKQLKEAITIREKIERLEKELNRLIASQTFAPTVVSARATGFRRGPKISMNRRAGLKQSALAKPGRSSPRGQLKKRILDALTVAGKSGIAIKDLSEKLGTSYGNISVWFHTTAKGVKQIKKVAPGKFAWVS